MCSPAQIRQAKKIRCVLVHDHVLLRQGLRRLLEDEPDMQVVDEAANSAEALQKVCERRPDIVIADPQIFDCPAEEIERLFLHESPESRILILTSHRADDPAPGPTLAARQTSAAELVNMVRRMAAANGTIQSAIAQWPADTTLPRNRSLTARELEVLKLLAEGRTVRNAAGVLGVSVKTVEAHKFNLMRKLGIHNKAELVMWAIQMSIVKVPVSF